MNPQTFAIAATRCSACLIYEGMLQLAEEREAGMYVASYACR